MLSQQYDDRQEYVRGHSPKIVVNGDVYDGEYKDGIRHGRGIYR